MSLRDAMVCRAWQYSVTANPTYPDAKRDRHFINENLTGAVLGDQKPARINFRTALLIVWGWNQLGTGMKFWLVIPNTKN